MIAVVALISFSRLYLGVHYLSDVLGGLAAGATWLALAGRATDRLRRRRHGRYRPSLGPQTRSSSATALSSDRPRSPTLRAVTGPPIDQDQDAVVADRPRLDEAERPRRVAEQALASPSTTGKTISRSSSTRSCSSSAHKLRAAVDEDVAARGAP